MLLWTLSFFSFSLVSSTQSDDGKFATAWSSQGAKMPCHAFVEYLRTFTAHEQVSEFIASLPNKTSYSAAFYGKLCECAPPSLTGAMPTEEKRSRELFYANLPWSTFLLMHHQELSSQETLSGRGSALYLAKLLPEVYQNTYLSMLQMFISQWTIDKQPALEQLKDWLSCYNITIGSGVSAADGTDPPINAFGFYRISDSQTRVSAIFRTFIQSSVAPLSAERFSKIANCSSKVAFLIYAGERNRDVYERLDKHAFKSCLDCINNDIILQQCLASQSIYARAGFYSHLNENEFHIKISAMVHAPEDRITKDYIQSCLMTDSSYNMHVMYFLTLFMTHFERRFLTDSQDSLQFVPISSVSSVLSTLTAPSSNATTSAISLPTIILMTWIMFGMQLLFLCVLIALIIITVRLKRKSPITSNVTLNGKVSGSIWTRE